MHKFQTTKRFTEQTEEMMGSIRWWSLNAHILLIAQYIVLIKSNINAVLVHTCTHTRSMRNPQLEPGSFDQCLHWWTSVILLTKPHRCFNKEAPQDETLMKSHQHTNTQTHTHGDIMSFISPVKGYLKRDRWPVTHSTTCIITETRCFPAASACVCVHACMCVCVWDSLSSTHLEIISFYYPPREVWKYVCARHLQTVGGVSLQRISWNAAPSCRNPTTVTRMSPVSFQCLNFLPNSSRTCRSAEIQTRSKINGVFRKSLLCHKTFKTALHYRWWQITAILLLVK